MPKIYMSQWGQDRWVIKKIYRGLRYGFFVDLAAGDGVKINNTHVLENIFGWSGVCIEAHPRLFEQLKVNRRATCVRACVDGKAHVVTFAKDKRGGGIVDWNMYYSEQQHPEKIEELRRKRALKSVKTRTLASILRRARAPKLIHYLSLDVEGAEERILRTFPWKEYAIGAMTVERPTKPLHKLILSKGFVHRKRLGEDECYVHRITESIR